MFEFFGFILGYLAIGVATRPILGKLWSRAGGPNNWQPEHKTYYAFTWPACVAYILLARFAPAVSDKTLHIIEIVGRKLP